MTNIYTLRRYFLFVVSLFINAFGVAFITKALLGTSPITSVTYVLSMFTPLSMGVWTIIINILFVVFEPFFMTRQQMKSDLRMFLLQIPISLCFGFFIDLSMHLLYWLNPATYVEQIGSLLVGCVILAVGIALEVKANIAMTSGEFFVRVISIHLKKEFGYVKLGFDSVLVLIALLLSIVFMSAVRGVREGTVIAALTVGPIVHFISPWYRFLDPWIKSGRHADHNQPINTTHVIITIAREFGSGGHLIGEMLSKELGIKLYDKEFIHMAAQRSGIDEAYIRKNEQSIPSFWLKCMLSADNGEELERSISTDDVLFVAESRIIQELAEKESCIIIGRCADFILKEHPHLIRVFCYADLPDACSRCVNEYKIAADKAEAEIIRINKNRRTHYEYYTGEKWGDPHHYNLMINTSYTDLPQACRMIKELYRRIQEQQATTEQSKR